MSEVTYVGSDEYHGFDPGDDNRPVSFYPGDRVKVSPAKAEQLLADFPDDFKSAGAKAPPPPSKEEPPAPPTAQELMDGNNREELNKLAVKAGVKGAAELPNKRAVAEAIVAAREADAS